MPRRALLLLAACLAPALARAADDVRAGGKVTLELDVLPILTAAGCNAGACHGKQNGQNGFQLSLLGFYPEFDYQALAQEARGRRVFPAAPDRSLLLLKATAQVPHGGGERIELGSPRYETLLQWIACGMPRRGPDDPTVERVSVSPPERSMASGETQPLNVTAHYSDGAERDVTSLAQFQSSEEAIVGVDDAGLVTAGPLPGEATIMARFLGHIATTHVRIPLPGDVPDAVYEKAPRKNFIDGHVWHKLQSLGITPSLSCDDATFLRRAHTDIIGRLPTPEEARAFLGDDSPDKRERLIDSLLQRPEFADFWANKFADLLLTNPYRVGIKTTLNYDAWIRRRFRENAPYDQLVRDLITAEGSTFRNGAVTMFRDRRTPDEITTLVSQLFLGIRLECAKCHHHPFEKWGQEHFYSFAAYFAQIGRKGRGLSPPISGSEELFFAGAKGEVQHPNTGETLPPQPLFGEAPEILPGGDRREALAAWLTSGENPFFREVMANRVWADLMGRGLVEPVDDLRVTNPPSNGPLLKALGEHFRDEGFDLKALVRAIANSHVYGLSSEPTERNVADTRNYSRHYRSRLRAEVLLDAYTDITLVPERFEAMPPGSRAIEVWTRRVPSLFLDTFGRPNENEDPPCERTGDTAVVQALHLMNAPNLHRKVTADSGRAAQLAASDKTPAEIVEELYLLVYARYPDEEERQTCLAVFEEEGTSRKQATEDILWALLNTPEFVFQN